MMHQVSRRSLITGLVSLLAAPAIVRSGSLMPVRSFIEPIPYIDITIRNAQVELGVDGVWRSSAWVKLVGSNGPWHHYCRVHENQNSPFLPGLNFVDICNDLLLGREESATIKWRYDGRPTRT